MENGPASEWVNIDRNRTALLLGIKPKGKLWEDWGITEEEHEENVALAQKKLHKLMEDIDKEAFYGIPGKDPDPKDD